MNTATKIYISANDLATIKKAQSRFRALNHALRRSILDVIETSGETTVTNIYIQLRLEQSVASQHLSILRQAKLVKARREGKFIFYSLNYKGINSLIHGANKILETSL